MKNIITLLAVFFAFGLGAQSLELVSQDKIVYYDASVPDKDIASHVKIKNTSAADKTYKVRRNGPFDPLCSTNWFCWDLCYLPTDNVSAGSLIVGANSTNSIFSGHIESVGNSVEDCCVIGYTFFNVNDLSDTLRVEVEYCATNSISINENSYSTFKVFPNPASNFINIEYTGEKDGNFQMFNVVGQTVNSQVLSAGQQKTSIDVSNLNSGVYFYTLQIDGKVMETKKLIIK